jgi:DNA-binding MarR family transcriptional regulator
MGRHERSDHRCGVGLAIAPPGWFMCRSGVRRSPRGPVFYAWLVTETMPTSDRQAATEALMATSRWMTAAVARTLVDMEDAVSVPQLRVLVMLSYRAPLNLTTIARGLGVNASNASRTCEKLVVSGLAVREEDPTDRRHLALALTPSGLRLVGSLMESRRVVLDEVVGHLSPVEQRRLAQGLTAFLAAAPGSGPGAGSDGSDSLIPWIR